MEEIWRTENGRWHFLRGKDAPRTAAAAAEACGGFVPDDEEEWEAEEAVSCYNCRLRRWTPDSFDCLRKDPDGCKD
jgi:hypothetical protein